MKRFLTKHLGNMGDMVFFVPPVLESLKKAHPGCHITHVTNWGFKDKRGRWGQRNQDGGSLNLMMTNPHIDQLVHWHDTKTSLTGSICHEDGENFPTWSKQYFEQQKHSGNYDGVLELDFGLTPEDNPVQKMYEAVGLPTETYSNYQLYLTDHDRAVAAEVMHDAPRPRIVLLESLSGEATRSWDPNKIGTLEQRIKKDYGVAPFWFGSRHTHFYRGRPLTLRENIATLTYADVGIGVLSGPLHFAAAVGLPTITLYCDHPIHRGAPNYFLNSYISNPTKKHRTLLGPSNPTYQILKPSGPSLNLTPAEAKHQNFKHWSKPGRQDTKSCLAVITVDEVMAVLHETLPV